MQELREFLEGSTIHGLAHISTARPTALKVAWVLVVVASFAAAVQMITSSYMEWREAPVSSMVISRPISDLTFPEVTVEPHLNTYESVYYTVVVVVDSISISISFTKRSETDQIPSTRFDP